ncbi:MAG: pentapeptide repeat-containing protein [Deltaproteobacteria bacterium]|nr:pentapeptide repeat-containing protein [Deltaproteobacteria bacterium]
MKLLTREDVEKGVKQGAAFEGANLKGIDLKEMDLSGGMFKNANFRYADLSNTNLSGANLSGASLRHAVLVNTNMRNADLSNADLTHADMRGSILVGARLSNAMVQGAKGISEKVFFTQELLDELNANGKLLLEGETITILTKAKPKFRLEQAARFTAIDSGTDTEKFVGKVKTLEELRAVGAEIFPDSVVMKENVYRVENGFIGLPVKEEAAAGKKEESRGKKDEELLAEFFLKNVK